MDVDKFLHKQMMLAQGGAGFSEGPSMDVVAQFFMDNGIQQHAQDTFLSLTPDQQQLVIAAGGLADARDPTAVLISRCSKARQGTLTAVQHRPGDWKCTACGELNFARNNNCRKCNMGRDVAAAPLDPAYADIVAIIDNYLVQNGIEEHAGATFRSLTPEMQQLVMDAGPLSDARDPTAVLVSRMNKAKQGLLQPVQMMPGDWLCPACGHHNFCRNAACRSCGSPNTGGGAAAGSMSLPSTLPRMSGGFQKRPAAMQFAPPAKMRRLGGGGIADKLNQYLLMQGIQQKAIDQFFELPPESQSAVIDAGPLEDARDPTAVLISRMSKARTGQPIVARMSMPGDWKCPQCNELNFSRNTACRRCGYQQNNSSPQVENFLTLHNIEAHAADTLRALGPQLQQLVMDSGSLADARDPTAVLISRINKARQGTLQVPQMMPGDWKCAACGDHNFMRNEACRKCGTARDFGGGPMNMHEGGNALSLVDTYLHENNIEQRAADNFRALPAHMQRLVMEAGSLSDARDPTAVLISRMNKAKQGILAPSKVMPGDWKCSACGEHNFARNTQCRKCATSQEVAAIGVSPVTSLYLPEKDTAAIEAYLTEHGIQDHAADTFRRLPSHLQRLVMGAGSLSDARDPTAVLISRMNKAKQGSLKPVQTMPGDWVCPACGEHNFARNSNCRKCATACEMK
eukprot:TRINITY_DN568_c0_g1_i2.p1 TRINITY_DN568_c0_g1~~TRINITY_DN568_c0_g1_i2.p1  ORF type:complete len:685 (-),score=101.09 TRINITY_DN568_c0_g1_i2:173-2227(-)